MSTEKSVWKKVSCLENKFRLEQFVLNKTACDFHNGIFDDTCWDCGSFVWKEVEFDEKLVANIDEKGYTRDGKYRFCSNSLGVVKDIKALIEKELKK